MQRTCHALAMLLAGCAFDPSAAGIPERGSPPVVPGSGVDPTIDPTASENVEVKLELADSSAALATLGLADNDATETQDVWFYDTAALDLFDAGVILRARKVHSGADDATVKARPMLPEQTAPGWLALSGAKCEVDETTASAASSCSLTQAPAKGAIDSVAGGQPIGSLYDADQLVFLGSLDASVSIDALAKFGPIASTEWTLAQAPQPIGLERWVLGNGQALLEASFRVAHADAASGLAALVAWANASGLAIAADQSDKTGTALHSY